MVVAHARDGGHAGRIAAQFKHEVGAGRSDVARCVDRRGPDDVFAIGQWALRREAPVATAIDQRGAQQHAVVVEAHALGARRRHAAEGGSAVVGDPVLRNRVLHHIDVVERSHRVQRGVGRGGVDGDGDGSAGQALVARCVGGGQPQAVQTFAQTRRPRRHAPRPARPHHHTGNRRPIGVQRDQLPRRGPRAAEGRCRVIAHRPIAHAALHHPHVVAHTHVARRRWPRRVECVAEVVLIRVVLGVQRLRSEDIRPIGPQRRHFIAPAAVRTHRGAAQGGATFADGHHLPHTTRTNQCGRAVVGCATVGHLAQHRVSVVFCPNHRHSLERRVERDRHRARFAAVARWILCHHAQRVFAVGQRHCGGHTPTAIGPHHRAAQDHGCAAHKHQGARLGAGAADGGRCIVCLHANLSHARAQHTTQGAHIVQHLENHTRGRGGVHHDHALAAAWPFLALNTPSAGGDAVLTFGKIVRQLKSPTPIGIGQHGELWLSVDPHRDPCAWHGDAADHGTPIVRGVVLLQSPLDQPHIVQQTVDRCHGQTGIGDHHRPRVRPRADRGVVDGAHPDVAHTRGPPLCWREGPAPLHHRRFTYFLIAVEDLDPRGRRRRVALQGGPLPSRFTLNQAAPTRPRFADARGRELQGLATRILLCRPHRDRRGQTTQPGHPARHWKRARHHATERAAGCHMAAQGIQTRHTIEQ